MKIWANDALNYLRAKGFASNNLF